MKNIILFLLLCACAHGATINAAGRSASQIQTAINSASNGDTVVVPAGNATWDSTGITITKGIVLDMTGVTITRGTGTVFLVDFTSDPTYGFRMTGATFTQTTADNMMRMGGNVTAVFTNAKFRIDHCTFSSTSSVAVLIQIYNTWGLFDHCTFIADDASEMIHNNAWGDGDDRGWQDDITPGGPDAIYVEDCTFTKYTQTTSLFVGTSGIESFYGSRTVIRYCTFNYCQIDQHGTAGNIGARWWEIYNNTFVIPSTGNANQSNIIDIRGGSGVIFNNVMAGGTNNGGGYLDLREEDTGTYPLLYQVGRGKNQTLDPAYIWNNTVKNFGDDPPRIIVNRDYYLSAKPSYAPYTYPHPLITGFVLQTKVRTKFQNKTVTVIQ